MVRIEVVSEPASVSVTEKACKRISPDAICGSQQPFLFLAAVPDERAENVELGVAGRG